MLIGCFDESGSSGEGGFVSIAGFVATEERLGSLSTPRGMGCELVSMIHVALGRVET